MAQRQFSSSDTSLWGYRFGSGNAGALNISSNTADSTPNTSFSASSASTSATFGSGTGFANGDLLLIHQSRNGGDNVGDWELNAISSGGGTGSVTLTYPTTHAYNTTAQVYLLKQYSSVTIDNGKTLSVTGWNGTKGGILALLVNGAAAITGSISVNGGDGSTDFGGTGGGYRGGNGQSGGGNANQGEGTSGGGGGATAANGNGGGGGQSGGGSTSAAGGGGGNGVAGQAGQSPDGGVVNGSGGNTAGVSTLVTMVFGGGGGGGAHNGGGGGGGSGAGLVLVIAKSIVVTGTMPATGGAGVNVGEEADGGFGAGGSILLKGQTITLGTNLVTALGATPSAGEGGFGGNGRIRVEYAYTISGSTNPTMSSAKNTALADTGGSVLFNFL